MLKMVEQKKSKFFFFSSKSSFYLFKSRTEAFLANSELKKHCTSISGCMK